MLSALTFNELKCNGAYRELSRTSVEVTDHHEMLGNYTPSLIYEELSFHLAEHSKYVMHYSVHKNGSLRELN